MRGIVNSSPRNSAHPGRFKAFHVHQFHVHQWVRWWFFVGVVCGAFAVSNILFRDLTRTQERILLIVGTMHWLLGGLVCWALEGVRMERPAQPRKEKTPERSAGKQEWHAASDFLFPGTGHPLLPQSRAQRERETVEMYLLEHPELKSTVAFKSLREPRNQSLGF